MKALKPILTIVVVALVTVAVVTRVAFLRKIVLNTAS
jgi:hypothetical protein